jgi:hypothetical protein
MNELTAIESRINQYLDAVREQISGLSPDEVDNIIDDLRGHIDVALQSRGDQPTLENIEAVLAEMDPPESFAPDLDETTGVVPKVSRTAIIGAVLLPFGILTTILYLIPGITYSTADGFTTNKVPEQFWWQWLFLVTILPLVTTILGLVSISQIRASKGGLIGKPLALVDALIYPILVFDGLLIALMFMIIATIPDGHLALTESLALLCYILVIIVDLIIAAIAWLKIP